MGKTIKKDMKAIEPVNIWQDGQNRSANRIRLTLVQDNLVDSATFLYEFIEEEMNENEPSITILAAGNVTISGEEYDEWGESSPINEDAYIIIANKLNITLL